MSELVSSLNVVIITAAVENRKKSFVVVTVTCVSIFCKNHTCVFFLNPVMFSCCLTKSQNLIKNQHMEFKTYY